MAKPIRNEKEKLLAELLAVRRSAPRKYELKLAKHLEQRIVQMKNGSYDEATLPDDKEDSTVLNEALKKNEELMRMVEESAQQYAHAKESNRLQHEKLTEIADSLHRVMEIERQMQQTNHRSPTLEPQISS